jgi:hypothetical protein
MKKLSLLLVPASSLALACGGGEPPPKAVSDAPVVEAPRPQGPKLKMRQELGEIDEAATKRTFAQLEPAIQKCHTQNLRRIEYLGGDVKLFLRIGEDGHVKYGFLEDSTLGDAETEKCIMGVLTGAQWPKPDGGEAEVRNGFGFDPAGDVRSPIDWSSDKLAPALGKNDALHKCTDGVDAKFKVTVYVAPGGKIQAAGVSTSSKAGAEKLDCIVDAIKGMKGVPSPGSWAGKVSFFL